MCEGPYGAVLVVLSLQNAAAFKVINGSSLLPAAFTREKELCLAGLGNSEFGSLVNVTVGMTGNRDRLFPESDSRLNAADKDRSAENGSVENRTNSSVWTFPHFLEVVFLNALSVRCDRCAFYADVIFFAGFSGVNADLVVGFVSVLETEVIILGVQLNEGGEKLVLDHPPDDSCHFIAVHFDDRAHFNFAHFQVPHFMLVF